MRSLQAITESGNNLNSVYFTRFEKKLSHKITGTVPSKQKKSSEFRRERHVRKKLFSEQINFRE